MRIKCHRCFKIIFFIATYLLLFNSIFAGVETVVFNILENSDLKIVFELKPFEVKFEELSFNGEMFDRPIIDGYEWISDPGKPGLPIKGILIGIPDNDTPDIQILESQVSILGQKKVCPAPTYYVSQDNDQQNLIEQYWRDEACYSQNRFYPKNLVEVSSIGRLRHQYIARIEFHPLQYNPVTKELKKIERLKIAIILNKKQLSKKTTVPSLPPTGSRPYESLYQNLLQNYQTARQWRIPSQAALQQEKQKTWYYLNSTYYKLIVKEEGIYRLNFGYLDSIGVDVYSIDPRTVKIYNKGEEQHLFVKGQEDGQFNQDDFIEFYGQPNLGDTSYYDPYTDANVYWLTWGGDLGLRMRTKTSLSEAATPINDYIKIVRLEPEKIYQHGVNDLETHNTEPIPGEGWVWRFFFPGESETITFQVSDLSKSEKPCSLKIKLKGTTLDPVKPNHHVHIFLNDSLIGDIYFNDVAEYLFEAAISSLEEGENRLVILSVGDTGAKIDQFLLDWIEVEYPRQLVAEGDYLKLDFSKPADVNQISAWGFNEKRIKVFDLVDHALIENAAVNPGRRMIFEVISAGFNDGSFAQIQINSQATVAGGYRGHNLSIVDEISGQVIDTRYFDTYLSTAEADSMARYVQNLPAGRIVLAAIRDEGSVNMTENAYLALESLGSQRARNVRMRDSWAMIGKKGAMIGSAIEAWSPAGSGAAIVQDTSIVPGLGNDFYVSFNDSIASNSSYAIISEQGIKTPAMAILDTSANLKSFENGADLIIVTHQNFLTSAQRLAEYHNIHDGLRVKVADVAEIYDEFNYGLLNPEAIRDFLKYAFDNWQSPSPSYVIFFGDASWDFKKNMAEAVKENYVPSYGNPVSDNWLVCFDGSGDFLPEMFVGRIPVETAEQADLVIDKIIAYENTPTESWKKNVLFITGGFNKSEQRTFMSQSNFLINNYVTPPPASCKVFQINKTTEGYFEGEKKQEVLDAINQGMMWVNFLGHAGSRTWDLMFNHPDIEELTNKDNYPFITSMTCHTGRFAEPEGSSFGEHFLLTENKGAIGFWGTTGWGYVFQDNVLSQNLFLDALVDTIHSLGEATTFAKLKLWENYGGGFYNVNAIHQYTLMGDPINDLTLPEKPDLTIGTSDIIFKPSAPSEADSFAILTFKIQNWGLACSDTFKINVYDVYDNRTETIASDILVPFVGLVDSVNVSWDLKNKAGDHMIRVVLDAQQEIEEVEENNNSQDFPIFVYSSKIAVSQPFDFQVISPKNVTLRVNNPAIAAYEDAPRYYQFELDTTVLFDSPALMASPQLHEGTIVTKWTTAELKDNTTYFWRCRASQGAEIGNWVSSSFTTETANLDNLWRQIHTDQFIHNDFNQTQLSSSGIKIEARTFLLQVESAGYTDGDYARITVNSLPVLEQHRGHNLVVISPNTGKVVTNRSFDTWASQNEANAMADFINGLEIGTYVLVAIKDDGSLSMTENAYQALEGIGSQSCRNVKFRDSWAIIGIKDASIGTVKERHIPTGQGIAIVQDTLMNYYPQGAVASTPIGPADSWNYVSWNGDVSSADTDVTLDVIGFNKTLSQWDTLVAGLSNFNQEDLSAINTKNYPLLKLRANLSDNEGLETPLLRDWSVSYEPVADPAISYQVVTFSADTLMEGDNLNIDLNVYNVGMKIVDSVKIRFSLSTPDSGKIRFCEDKILTDIPIDSFKSLSRTWESSGRTGNSQIFIEVDPDNEVNELTESNNYYSHQIYVMADSMKPQVQVTYDGKQVVAGDYVSNSPAILVNIYDNSSFLIENDTTKVNLFLDNSRINYSGNENSFTIAPIKNADEPKLKAQVRFAPELSDGDHVLEVFVKDARNNFSYHRDDFQVTSDFKILDVLNYPNPFCDGTEFTFNLTQQSDKVTIKIFTVAGRLISTLDYHHLEAGFHHLYWNGLDQDHDELSNGVYLYKIIARSGEKQVEQIEKLVIMR